MSGETIRSVIIKIRLEQSGPTKLTAPDIGPAQQAIERASKSSVDAFSREEKAAVQAYSRIMREREKAATTAEKLADRTAKYADRIDPTGGHVLGNEAAYQERRRAADTEAETRATTALAAASRQRIEAYINIGESALRAARGVAFMTAASEEDLQVSLRRIAVAQGMLDAFSGTANAIKNMTYLTEVQTAAQIALNVACSVTPAGWVAIGVAAAAAGVIYATTTDYTNEANRALEHQQGTLRNLGTDWEKLAEQASRGAENLRAAGQDFDTAMEALRLDNRKFLANPDDMLRMMRVEADIKKSQLDNMSDRGELGVGVAGAAQRDIEKNRIEAAYLQEHLAIREKQTAELQRQRDIAQEALEISKRTIEAEKDRLMSQTERIGRMSKGDQERARMISGKVSRGEDITEQEARDLDRFGLGRDVTSAFYRRRGQEAGADAILGDLGEKKALEQLKSRLDSQNATLGEFIKDADEAVRDSRQEMTQDLNKLIEILKDTVRMKAFFEAITKEVEKLKQANVTSTVGRLTS